MDVDHLLDRCTFPPAGTAVRCAFSGGADSTALVLLAVAAGCRVEAVHVDHGLRPSSRDEAARAAELAATIGVPFRCLGVAVAPGPNLEARARDARHAALGPDAATGHTADDQAETVLINLLRGAGTSGLAGIRPGPRHPILALRRADTRRLVLANGLTPVVDPTNTDPRFVRNRVRGELLPLLDAIAGRDVAALLARSADVLADDEVLLDHLAGVIDVADARAVTAAPRPLGRRAVRRWLTGPDGHPPSLAVVDRVLAVAAGATRACEIDSGRRVERHRQRLRITQRPESTGQSGDRAVVSYDEMGNSDHAGVTR